MRWLGSRSPVPEEREGGEPTRGGAKWGGRGVVGAESKSQAEKMLDKEAK